MEAAQGKFNLPHKNMGKRDNKSSCSMFAKATQMQKV